MKETNSAEKAVKSTEVNEVETTGTTTKKVTRRGIGTATGTTRLKFSHELAKNNSLFLGHIDSIKVTNISIGEEKTGMPSFNGMEIPKLTILFASNEEDVNKRHYVSLTFTAVESNAKTIPGGDDAWKVDNVFDWIKHILNVFVLKGRNLTEEEEEALSLTYQDFDENGEYMSVDSEDVIAGWRHVFESFENIMNRGKDGAPYYKNKDNRDISIWIKLLRYIKKYNRKTKTNEWVAINNGHLVFPTFPGEGCIELYKQNTLPSIKVDIVRECITPKNIDKPKTPTNIGMGMNNSIMGGVAIASDIPAMSSFEDNLMDEASEDSPF